MIQNGRAVTNNNVFTVAGAGNALDNEQVANMGLDAGGAQPEGRADLRLTWARLSTNAAGDTVQIDASGKLTLNNAVVLDGVIGGSGEIDLTGLGVIKGGTLSIVGGLVKAGGSGNALDGETIFNTGGIEVLGSGALTFDQSTTVANGGGTITVDASGKLILNRATVHAGPDGQRGDPERRLDLTNNNVLHGGGRRQCRPWINVSRYRQQAARRDCHRQPRGPGRGRADGSIRARL